MSFTGFGVFLKTAAAPLGIKTGKLADGSYVESFLCEAIAATGTKDTTCLADWHKYLAFGPNVTTCYLRSTMQWRATGDLF
jgi:allophanate hydrolase